MRVFCILWYLLKSPFSCEVSFHIVLLFELILQIGFASDTLNGIVCSKHASQIKWFVFFSKMKRPFNSKLLFIQNTCGQILSSTTAPVSTLSPNLTKTGKD